MIEDDNHIPDLLRDLERLHDDYEPTLHERFSPEFMERFTDYETFIEFVEDGGWQVMTEDEFWAIPDAEFEPHVRANTPFLSWDEMRLTAYNARILREVNRLEESHR